MEARVNVPVPSESESESISNVPNPEEIDRGREKVIHELARTLNGEPAPIEGVEELWYTNEPEVAVVLANALIVSDEPALEDKEDQELAPWKEMTPDPAEASRDTRGDSKHESYQE